MMNTKNNTLSHGDDNFKYSKKDADIVNNNNNNNNGNNTRSFVTLVFIFVCALLVLYSIYLSFPKLEE